MMDEMLNDHAISNVAIWEEVVSLPTYATGEPDVNPMFLERRVYQGSSGKVYPLPVTETLSDEKQDKEYRAVFLENKYLKVMVLPELGGRIHRATDKTNGYEFVYYNQVIKPALVGLAGPWISGGIEFNWPQHHRPSTFMPIEYHIDENEDGSKTLWVGEIERMYGTKGMAAFTLHPDKAYIEIKGQLYNRTPVSQTFLWWANPAVAVNDHTFSVFPPDVHAVMDHGKRAVSTFPIATGEYYKFDYSAGIDISRYRNIQVPTSYMAYHSDYDFIGNYDESKDAGLMHIADHHIAPGKKQWTWGNGDFGQAWDRNLTDEDGPYIELMTGVYTDNQPDFTWLKPHEEKTFTQYFMPYKEVGNATFANKDVIIRYEQKGEDMELVVYVTSSQSNVHIMITKGDLTLIDEKVNLDPSNSHRLTAIWEERIIYDTVCTITTSTNEVLASFSPQRTHDKPIPEPAEALPPPEQLKSNEELYLAATHLIQYRHASYDPVDYLLEGLQRDRTDIRLNNTYGLHLFRQGRFEQALSHFQRAVTKSQWKNPNPYTSEPYYHMGLTLWMLGRYEKAYDAFFKAVWSAETQNVAYYRLACLQSRWNHHQKALEFVEKALIYHSHDMKSRLLKTILLRKLGKSTSEWIEESRQIDPLDHGLAYEQTIGTDEKSGWLALMRREGRYFFALAFLYEEMGDVKEALSILSHALANDPMTTYAKGFLTWLDSGEIEKSRSYYHQAEKLSPRLCFPTSLDEMRVLQHAIWANPEGSQAQYLLGNLLYDYKRYDDAQYLWERSAELNPHFPTVQRNLAIVYHNLEKDIHKAFEAISKAQELDPSDARILLEYDQLAEKLGQSPRQRLLFLDRFSQTFIKRDDLYLRRVTLLNCLGHHELALDAIMARKFHPWEGGEGLVSGQYVQSLIGFARQHMEHHEERKAIEYLSRTFTWPQNLGEGRLPHTQDTIACYLLGNAHQALGKEEEAARWWRKATVGLDTPAESHYYNDQPSDTIFYQGLACRKLGDTEGARKRFNQLATYGRQHQFDSVMPDYFAVSLPETSVFHTDVQKQHVEHCLYHLGLGLLGLGDVREATTIFSSILQEDPSHQGAIVAMMLCGQWPNC